MAGTEDLGLRRLFRPPLDTLSVEEQVDYYRKRNLVQSKLHRTASSSFEVPLIRRRVIDASTFEHRTEDHDIGSQVCRVPFKRKDRLPLVQPRATQEDRQGGDLSVTKAGISSKDYDSYQKWLSDRRTLREKFDRMGLSKTWLLAKDRTVLEGKILGNMYIKEQQMREEVERSRQKLEMVESSGTTLCVPKKAKPPPKPRMPLGLPKLEEYISRNQLTLLDLFKRIDHNKDWRISAEDFVRYFKQCKADLSDSELKELFASFEVKRKNAVTYKEFISGVAKWSNRYCSHFHEPSQVQEDTEEQNEEQSDEDMESDEYEDTEKQLPAEKSVDSVTECFESTDTTLSGVIGDVDGHYRKKLQKEYSYLCNICEDHDLVLSEALLRRALLLPEDHSKEAILSSLSKPKGSSLLSRDLEREVTPKEPSTKSSVSRYGGAYTQLRGPRKGRVVKLSTGRARIQSKTDCWMTFGQYMDFIKSLGSHYELKHHSPPDHSAFWPGSMLDKLRLYIDGDNRKASSVNNVFLTVNHQSVSSPSSVYTSRCGWPQNQAGYIQFGQPSHKSYIL